MTTTELKALSDPILGPDRPKEDPKPISFYLYNLFSLTFPNIISTSSWTLQGIVGMYFLGLLNNVIYIDGYSLAYVWLGSTSTCLLLGMGGGIDTLVSQSFGRKDFRMCGVYFYRACLILSVALIPALACLFAAGPILGLLGIEESIIEVVQNCSWAMAPAVVLYVPIVVLDKFMLAQKIAKPQMMIQLINAVLFPLFCYLFVNVLNFGYVGAALTRTLIQFFYLLGMILYLVVSKKCSHCFGPITSEVFSGWGEYLSCAVPTFLLFALEMWSGMILNLFAGMLGTTALGVNSITELFATFIFKFSLGVGVATGTFVGNSIGEGSAERAQKYTKYGAFVSFCFTSMLDLIMLVFRDRICRVFVSDPEVVSLLKEVIIILSVFVFFDGIKTTFGRALVGLGKQKYATLFSLISYYGIMIPLSAILSFYLDFGVYGVWISLCIGAALLMFGMIGLLLRLDWEKMAELASR